MAGLIPRPRTARTRTHVLKRIGSVTTAALLLVSLLPFLAAPAYAATTWKVDDDLLGPCSMPGPVTHTTIPDAVAAAAPGDTIFVCPGIYDRATIDKTLTLYGDGGHPWTGSTVAGRDRSPVGDPTIEAIVNGGSVFAFGLDANNVIIDGFRMSAFTSIAALNTIEGTQVRNNIIGGGVTGLSFGNLPGTQAVIEHNYFLNHDCCGAAPYSAIHGGPWDNVLIRNNLFENNRRTLDGGGGAGLVFTNNETRGDGAIAIHNTTNAVISNNWIHGATASIDPQGIRLSDGNVGTSITGNNFSDRPGSVALEVNDDGGGGSSEVSFVGNHVTGWQNGIVVAPTGHGFPPLHIHFNRFANNSGDAVIGSGSVDAQHNWWGCSEGPDFPPDCDTVSSTSLDAWLVLDVTAGAPAVSPGNTTTITADLRHDQGGSLAAPGVPDGTPVTFSTTQGSVFPTNTTTVNGVATTTFTGGASDATITATVDNESDSVTVGAATVGLATTDPNYPSEPDSNKKLHTTVTHPGFGVDHGVTITETYPSRSSITVGATSYGTVGAQAAITAPVQATIPMEVEFELDASLLAPTGGNTNLIGFFNGSPMTALCSPATAAFPNPCLKSNTTGPGAGDATLKYNWMGGTGTWTFAYPCTRTGTDGPDRIVGTGANDIICGRGGNDDIIGRGGHDLIFGGSGRDTIRGETGQDHVFGESGDDVLIGNGDADKLYGSVGNDELYGRGGNDEVHGEDGNDRLVGSAGNEGMSGGPGTDDIFAGEGADWVHAGAGNDRILGSGGDDTLYGGDGHDAIFGGAGGDFVFGDNDSPGPGDGNDQMSTGEGNDTINTGNGNNLVHAGFDDDNITGGTGKDHVLTGEGDDVVGDAGGENQIYTQSGDDNIWVGGLDHDIVDAGEGNDFVTTIGGKDEILLGGGDDTVHSGDGNDHILADKGNDTIFSNGGDDAIDANEGDDYVESGSGNDQILSGGGDDTIDTGEDDDKAFGSDGNDNLIGNTGDDVLYGGRHDDQIDGGDAVDLDLCFGEDGTDTVVDCEEGDLGPRFI